MMETLPLRRVRFTVPVLPPGAMRNARPVTELDGRDCQLGIAKGQPWVIAVRNGQTSVYGAGVVAQADVDIPEAEEEPTG